MGVTHKLMVADSKLLTLRLNVTNLFNTEYLSYLFPADEADYTGMQYMGLDTAHEGRFGTLRRFSLGLRYTF
jgi:outer membrane receptor protein involved in Fe transport